MEGARNTIDVVNSQVPISVSCVDGTYSAGRRTSIQLAAESILANLAEMLGTTNSADKPISIRLVDRPDVESENNSRSSFEPIVLVLSPESGREQLPLVLTHAILNRHYGPAALSSKLVPGLAGYAGCTLPSELTSVDSWIRSEYVAGHPILGIVPHRRPNKASTPSLGMRPQVIKLPQAVIDPATTSFFIYLHRRYGKDALRKYWVSLSQAETSDPYLIGFGKPENSLKQEWMDSIRRSLSDFGGIKDLWCLLRPLIQPYRSLQVELLVYIAISAALNQAFPLALRYLIQACTAPPKGVSPGIIALRFASALLATYIVTALTTVRQSIVTSQLSQKVLRSLQAQLFEKLQWLGHDFYGRIKVGDIMTRLSADVSLVQQSLSQLVNSGIYQLVVLLVAIGVILYDTCKAGVWWLGVLLLAFIPIFAYLFASSTEKTKEASFKQQLEIAKSTSFIQENLMAHAVIKALGLEKLYISRYKERIAEQSGSVLASVKLSAESSLGLSFSMGIAQTVLLSLGGFLVLENVMRHGVHHGMTLDVLGQLTGEIPLMLGQVAGLSNVGQSVQQASGALKRVMDLHDEPILITDGPTSLPPLQKEICLENVIFGYGGDRTILDRLDMTIPAGKTVAIVGASGSGKSTIINLLMRFWDVQEGSVTYDGIDVRSLKLESLRRQIGLVFQDATIFDATIKENIRIGAPEASDDDVIEAAMAAHLHDDILLTPKGYDSPLSERGGNISGGQRQRIAIARALLRKPSILLLDEATSALDSPTEAGIVRTIQSIKEGRTVIAITHRLALAMSSDWIFVLKEGQIVEQGSHKDLSISGGLYQKMLEEQTGVSGLSHREIIDVDRLRRVPILANFEDKALAKLVSTLSVGYIEPESDIVTQGELGDALYLLISGDAEVVISADDIERQVNILHAGDFFGEISLLRDEPRTATVTALSSCMVYRLARSDFDDLLIAHPEEKSVINNVMVQRLNALSNVAASEQPPELAAAP